MSLTDDVAKYYAARAREYDVTAGYQDLGAEHRRASTKARFRMALRGLDVVEIACGTGYWTAVIATAARPFLTILHTRLTPGAFVLFSDQLPYVSENRRGDENGNILEARTLRSGVVFEVVKNFPTEPEIVHVLRGIAHTVVYRAFPHEGRWTLSYKVR